MMAADNQESYETISWILDNADMGFFIVTAPHRMQREIAERYETSKVEIYDYAQNASSFSYPELSAWADSRMDADFLFVLNMQVAIRDENDMLSFNLSRDMLSKKHKAWLFFMTKDLENRLSTFAFDIYSYVRLKAHFLPEKEDELGRQEFMTYDIDDHVNIEKAREALERYRDLEEELTSLPLDTTPREQLLSAAITLSNIAKLYRNCADYANALRLLEITRDIRETHLGTWHPDTASIYNDIAIVYNDQGDYGKALEWNDKALAIREKTLGKEHPDTANTYNNIAFTYYKQGDYGRALELLVKALAIMKKTLGEEHPSTLNTKHGIEITQARLRTVQYEEGTDG